MFRSDECVCVTEHVSGCWRTETDQRMERGDGEDSQTAKSSFRGTACGGQEALGVGQLSSLQAGQVAAHTEQIDVEPLQVLIPLLDL